MKMKRKIEMCAAHFGTTSEEMHAVCMIAAYDLVGVRGVRL